MTKLVGIGILRVPKFVKDPSVTIIEIDPELAKRAQDRAIDKFTRNGQEDKVSLLRFTNTPKIVTYVCGNFSDLATGPMTRLEREAWRVG